ncbi:hypothetical protein SCB71_14940 [Herbiconiux sp. KACC 21604]|uniref:hypothetical protein n=1 Tax=unclassified Herbiconiux TaxID=2618217 RepID=UPI0014910E64|nr:hypothetical protein [Herbiconiux sp. SALV-R1]QJU54433.1 hypothetical protein HL652_12880 [Herbiconiux sp. SALV-R1]WPO85509.1 hypothetical protein SCB71_14940 [Herbiconiux sp. KACC 21604]
MSAVDTARRLAKRVIRRRLLHGHYRSTRVHYQETTGREVPVTMCLWNRPTRLIDMLRSLDGQDHPDGVTLHIWNSNKLDHEFYLGVLREFRATGALKSVQIVRTPYNLGSMGRFYLAREHAKAYGPGPVIVVDDDENLQPGFVSAARAAYAPDVVAAWWAFEVGREYYDRKPADVGGPVDHVGPGGMICDSSIFLDDEFFTTLPERFWFVDDLWFTWYAKKLGKRLEKLDVEIEFVMDETNQSYGLFDLKLEFFAQLYPELVGTPPKFEFPEG